MTNRIIIILIMLGCRLTVFAQQPAPVPDWKYIVGKNDVKVYARSVPDSRVKALKAECLLLTTMAEVKALIMDVSATVKWMCHAKRCHLIRKISENEVYYYTEVSLPWPLDNRDFVTHAKLSENPQTGVVTVLSPAVPDLLPVYTGKVRINHSKSIWTLTPAEPGKVKVQYELMVDPGGMIPAQVVNAFAARAPIETFENMKRELKARRQGAGNVRP